MTAKQYLLQIRRLTFEIEEARAEIERLYSNIKAVSYGGVPGARDNDSTLHLVQKIMKLQDVQRERVEELLEKRQKIISEIKAMPDLNVSRVLYYRYCENMKFPTIAQKMFYSKQRVYQLHVDGLQYFDRLIRAN